MRINSIKCLPALLVLCVNVLFAQSTFIKRYKNTPIAESGVAVCELPNNRIAVVGQQANGFAWQAPMIIITDSLGNQLHHFVDTACFACDPFDAAADSEGNIYIAAKAFGGKASVIKYDTLGNRIWLKQFCPYNIESSFQSIDVISDSLIIVGGVEATDNFGAKAILVAFNNQSDTLWSLYFGYGLTIGFTDITHDSTYIYVSGIDPDTAPPYQSATYLRTNYNGQNPIHRKLDNGRKQGWSIIPLTLDSILIGGIAYNADGWGSYCFVSLIDSLGNVLQTIEDSNYLYNWSTKMDFDRKTQTLYLSNFDSIYESGTRIDLDKISAYRLPITSLQQPTWEKTITGSYNITSFRDLKVAKDGTVLHTGTAVVNCPNCPYLLKADENTCADLVSCDTTFISSVSIEELSNFAPKIYPNPFNQFIQVSGIDYAQLRLLDYMGRELLLRTNITSNTKIDLPPLPNGIYLVELKKGEMKWTEKMVRQ